MPLNITVLDMGVALDEEVSDPLREIDAPQPTIIPVNDMAQTQVSDPLREIDAPQPPCIKKRSSKMIEFQTPCGK